MKSIEAEVVVLGSGPGGYAAAFYAADKGKKVTLVESRERLGGVCLHDGCIPSKALLHASHLIEEAKDAKSKGLHFGEPQIDLNQLRRWKDSVVSKLAEGVEGLAARRGVEIVKGRAQFSGNDTLQVQGAAGETSIGYQHLILATGSNPALPKVFDLGDSRVMTSTEALQLKEVPGRLLVVGGGYIGMELGTVYAALGSQVVVAEALDSILAETDPDLRRPVMRYAQEHFEEVRVSTQVSKLSLSGNKIQVSMKSSEEQEVREFFDHVLVSVGRTPNTQGLALEKTSAELDARGFVKVDSSQRTKDAKIFAIGDVVGGPLLAHKAVKEARVAVSALLGEEIPTQEPVIPAVIFTTPEIAWCGLTEIEAKKRGIQVKVARFPWAASGRAMTLDHTEGITKLIVDPNSERVLGVGIVGYGAGDLIGEGVLALHMGAKAKDIADSIHPHPTLSESLMESAEVFYGTATHVYFPKKTKQENV